MTTGKKVPHPSRRVAKNKPRKIKSLNIFGLWKCVIIEWQPWTLLSQVLGIVASCVELSTINSSCSDGRGKMNIQYIRFFETSHSRSRGRQSVFDSIQNNLIPDFQPELGEWEVYYGLLPF